MPAPVTPLMASTITGPFSATQPARTAGAAGKARCGGIATGAGDQHGFAVGMVGCGGLQVLAEQLGQTEGTGLEQLGARMLGGIPSLKTDASFRR